MYEAEPVRGEWIMRRVLAMRVAVGLALVIIAASFLLVPAGRAQSDDPEALNKRAIELQRSGKFAEAVTLAERYAEAMKSRHGAEAPQYAIALNNLAELYRAQGRYAEAEPLYKRSLAIAEKALDPDHPTVGTHLNNLAALSPDQGP